MEDILSKVNGATLFSVCDLKACYHHCELDFESSLLTTFGTPFGRYRWLRLPFGLKVSSEIFQKRLVQAMEGLEDVQCIAEDVIIYGDNSTHDIRMRMFLQRCLHLGIKLNMVKCLFRLKEVNYMGHVISHEGLKPYPMKVAAIVNMEPPTDVASIERVKVLVNYLSRFMPKLADGRRPISILTHKGVEWTWGDTQKAAFDESKRLLAQAPVLAYFDPNKQLSVQSHANSKEIGDIFLQEGQPLCHVSRALTDTESRYAIIEKDMLAIAYVLGK